MVIYANLKMITLVFSVYCSLSLENRYLEKIYKYTLKKDYPSDWKKYFMLSNVFTGGTIQEKKKVIDSIDIKHFMMRDHKFKIISKILLSQNSRVIFKLLKKYHSSKEKFLKYFMKKLDKITSN